MLFRCTVAARQFLAPNLFEMGEDRGLAAQAIEIVVRGRTPPGRHIDFELGAEMVDHGLARLTRDNRVERPGDGPGAPAGTSLIGKRAQGIVALANVASLDPATIQPLVDLTPFLGGKRPALVAGQPGIGLVGLELGRKIEAARMAGLLVDHPEGPAVAFEARLAGDRIGGGAWRERG